MYKINQKSRTTGTGRRERTAMTSLLNGRVELSRRQQQGAQSIRRKPNILLLGAAGHVAKAVLSRLAERPNEVGRVVLLDRNDPSMLLRNHRFNSRFIRQNLSFPIDAREFHELLRSEAIDVVLDLTDMDTLPILEATDRAGVTYVNTALNDSRRGIADVLARIHPFRHGQWRAPHILSSGMNPGVVNIWVWHGVKKFGVPEEILHFEYDDSTPASGWQPIITWSPQEFLTEVVWERTGVVEDGEPKLFLTNALRNREDMRGVLSPILKLNEYPHGFTVLHEENLKLGQALGVSSRYIYAIHPITMEYLIDLFDRNGTVRIDELQVADNSEMRLVGADTIGVRLRYAEKDVYFVHRFRNEDVMGTNATCAQVACGVEAALFTLATEPLERRVYFATDLYESGYSEWIFRNMHIEQSIFDRTAKRTRSVLPSLLSETGVRVNGATKGAQVRRDSARTEQHAYVN